MNNQPNFKRCPKCGIKKPISEFSKRQSRCKRCACETTIQWQKENPEKYIANVRRSQKKNPEKYEAYNRSWRNANKEIALKRAAKRRNLGFQPLNDRFECSHGHHLYLEDNLEFVIFLPSWLHRLHDHTPKMWKNMDTINAIALDYWINGDLYDF